MRELKQVITVENMGADKRQVCGQAMLVPHIPGHTMAQAEQYHRSDISVPVNCIPVPFLMQTNEGGYNRNCKLPAIKAALQWYHFLEEAQ